MGALYAERPVRRQRLEPPDGAVVAIGLNETLEAESDDSWFLARALLDQWRDSIHTTLIKFGVQESTAEDDSSVLLAALEAALILSRANQSTQPLDTVQRFFTTSLT